MLAHLKTFPCDDVLFVFMSRHPLFFLCQTFKFINNFFFQRQSL